jgi:hypothetical protein
MLGVEREEHDPLPLAEAEAALAEGHLLDAGAEEQVDESLARRDTGRDDSKKPVSRSWTRTSESELVADTYAIPCNFPEPPTDFDTSFVMSITESVGSAAAIE